MTAPYARTPAYPTFPTFPSVPTFRLSVSPPPYISSSNAVNGGTFDSQNPASPPCWSTST
jgi:hypothetical protein